MMVIKKMEEPMDKEHTDILVVVITKENEKMDKNLGRDYITAKTKNMKESFCMGNFMVKEQAILKMAEFIMDNG